MCRGLLNTAAIFACFCLGVLIGCCIEGCGSKLNAAEVSKASVVTDTIRGSSDGVDEPQIKWSGLVPTAAPPCDCCKPKCTCESGKRNDDCECYPCRCADVPASIKFSDIAFATVNGKEEIAFVRTASGKVYGSEVFKDKALLVNLVIVETEQVHDWAAQTADTEVVITPSAVYFYGDKKVARLTAPSPVWNVQPTCPGGNCPRR